MSTTTMSNGPESSAAVTDDDNFDSNSSFPRTSNFVSNTQRRERAHSEAEISSGILSDILRENDVYLGGSAMGKGFRRAARYYLRKQAPKRVLDKSTPADAKRMAKHAHLLKPGVEQRVEDAFYVVDIGVIVSQFHQWRKHFPRVEPFYAVKCNPDPVVVKTLATLGCHFDCASRAEIQLVQDVAQTLPPPRDEPSIIYANPTKARAHVIDAVCRGVTLMTFDNAAEVQKCAAVSDRIQLILRIITDDTGSQCRLSSKYGAPKSRWRDLLKAAKRHGLNVVGVSFHVGSGCRDASRYEMALRDARELFDLARTEFGFEMNLLDIGGGFPGETHSLWNPAAVFGDPTAASRRKYTIDEEIPDVDETGDDDEKEGLERDHTKEVDGEEDTEHRFMYFSEIAEEVAPIIDELFPESSGVRIIAEPGRYLVAASSTLVASVLSVRNNAKIENVEPIKISDRQASYNVDQITRAEEDAIVSEQGKPEHRVIGSIMEELADYSKLYARVNLSQQEVDVYTDKADLTDGQLKTGAGILAPPVDRLPEGQRPEQFHTVEGMQIGLVAECYDDVESISSASGGGGGNSAIPGALTLAAAGEAAVSGVVLQAMADSAPLQDDYAYYINDGVYGAFNNILFDHATVRPRRLRYAISKSHRIVETTTRDGFRALEAIEEHSSADDHGTDGVVDDSLYPSTVFGPTCDSMDVISRSVLLPKLSVGDWLYFQNMGAYTSAAASSFNGFTPTEKFYVCSVQPEHFEKLVEGPDDDDDV